MPGLPSCELLPRSFRLKMSQNVDSKGKKGNPKSRKFKPRGRTSYIQDSKRALKTVMELTQMLQKIISESRVIHLE